MTEPRPLNVLFLCTHNSARGTLAGAMPNHLGGARFRAHSAGSSPRSGQQPHPMAIHVLQAAGVATDGLHSKSWDHFAGPDAPPMDLIITVCDNAAGEACPFWPGHPATAHWGYADPSAVEGSEAVRLAAFRHTLHEVGRRIQLSLNLPSSRVHRMVLEPRARELANQP